MNRPDCAYPDLVPLRNALSYADDQANFILNGFDDGVASGGRWDVEHSSIRLCFPDGL